MGIFTRVKNALKEAGSFLGCWSVEKFDDVERQLSDKSMADIYYPAPATHRCQGSRFGRAPAQPTNPAPLVTAGGQLTSEEVAISDAIQTIWNHHCQRKADGWALQRPQAVATCQPISHHALASQEADSPIANRLVPWNKVSGAVPQPLSPCSIASTPSGSTLLEGPKVTETKEPETGAIALDNLWCQLGLQVTPDNLASEFRRCFNKHMDLVDEMALEPHTHNGRCKELAQRVKDTKLELAVIESYQNLIRYNQATNHTPQGYLVCPEAFHQFGGISYAYTSCPSKQVRRSWERLQHFYQGAMHKALDELARQQGQVHLCDPIAHALHFLAKAGV